MADAEWFGTGHARPKGPGSRLRLWLVLPLGAAGGGGSGAGGRRLEENVVARRSRHVGHGDCLHQADTERLELSSDSFGLVYGSLALHHVENLDRLMSVVYRSLIPGASQVFS